MLRFKEEINRVLFFLFFLSPLFVYSQADKDWNGKKCAVVLTYDDALNVHLDKVIPMLNEYKFKGTFYLIGSSPVVAKRIAEWRLAAKKGHELGNHSLNHPCDGTLPGRSFVSQETDLSKYSVARAVKEVQTTNILLEAIDGKKERTYAYPCGDLKIGESYYYNSLKQDFIAARGVSSNYPKIKEIDLSNVNAFSQKQTTGEHMIEEVKKAQSAGSMIVFLFHGVGGEHSLNVELDEHKKLLDYLKKNKKDIWIAPMVDVARFIKLKQAN